MASLGGEAGIGSEGRLGYTSAGPRAEAQTSGCYHPCSDNISFAAWNRAATFERESGRDHHPSPCFLSVSLEPCAISDVFFCEPTSGTRI